MKKSNFSIMSHVYHRIVGLSVVRELTGGVYKNARPVDSSVEDIVIKADDCIVEAGSSVGVTLLIYSAPVFSDRGAAVELVPDFKRLEYISSCIFDGIDEVFMGGCLTWVEHQRFRSEGDMFCCEMNIKVCLRGA